MKQKKGSHFLGHLGVCYVGFLLSHLPVRSYSCCLLVRNVLGIKNLQSIPLNSKFPKLNNNLRDGVRGSPHVSSQSVRFCMANIEVLEQHVNYCHEGGGGGGVEAFR